MGLFAIPMNVLALYKCSVYYIFAAPNGRWKTQVLLLLVFGISSMFALIVLIEGLMLIIRQRREYGIRWWCSGFDPDGGDGWREGMIGAYTFIGIWLLLMSLTFEAYTAPYVPPLYQRIWNVW